MEADGPRSSACWWSAPVNALSDVRDVDRRATSRAPRHATSREETAPLLRMVALFVPFKKFRMSLCKQTPAHAHLVPCAVLNELALSPAAVGLDHFLRRSFYRENMRV